MLISTATTIADLDYAPIKELPALSFYIMCTWTKDSTDPCKMVGGRDGQVLK